MNDFDPKDVADKILQQYAVGDIVPSDVLTAFIERRLPEDSDTYAVAKTLIFERLTRIGALRTELLERKILAIQENNALALIKPEHHVDRSLRRVRRRMDRDLLRGMNEVENLDMTGLPNHLITEQHDAITYLDMLRQALNPRSRRTRFGTMMQVVSKP